MIETHEQAGEFAGAALEHSQSAVTLQRVAAFCFTRSRLFEVARVLVRLDHVAGYMSGAKPKILAKT